METPHISDPAISLRASVSQLTTPWRGFVGRRLTFQAGVIGALLTLAASVAVGASAADEALTTVDAIRRLSPEEADRQLPVRLRAVVTRATPHELFIHDGDSGIFVWKNQSVSPRQRGDYVEITGTTHSGHFTPVLRERQFERLGQAPLPTPRKVTYHDLASGREDCQWVEVEGVVRTVRFTLTGNIRLWLAFDHAVLQVDVSEVSSTFTSTLVGARIRVVGVVGGSKTPQRQWIEPVLWVDYTPQTFEVKVPGRKDIYSAPIRSADTLLGYGSSALSGELARVRGVVLAQLSSNRLFIRDGTHGLEVRLQNDVALQPGDIAEVVGFPDMGTSRPVLQHAFARRAETGPSPAAAPVTAQKLLDCEHEANLVKVEGTVRDLFLRHGGAVMVVSAGDRVFSADLDVLPAGFSGDFPPVDSRVSLTGICQIDQLTSPNLNHVVTPASFRLHLRTIDDLQILSRPSWWTPRRLLTAVAFLSAFFVVAVGWIWTLNRRVRAQMKIILGNARNAAIHEERNRIAREFHDTVEQQLAGATILLDAIAAVVVAQPERAREELVTARAMLRHSLDEAQRAVSDLRDDTLFARSLKLVIEESVRELLYSTSTAVQFQYEGDWPELDSVVKKHILRIVQESITNALKHAAASSIVVIMRATEAGIELRVVDNGRGFDPQRGLRRDSGKFGLIGLQERADKIRAKLTIESAPARGTTVAVLLGRSQFNLSQ